MVDDDNDKDNDDDDDDQDLCIDKRNGDPVVVDDPGELLADGDDLADNCTDGLGKQGVVSFSYIIILGKQGIFFLVEWLSNVQIFHDTCLGYDLRS